jgi:hypothetical protein
MRRLGGGAPGDASAEGVDHPCWISRGRAALGAVADGRNRAGVGDARGRGTGDDGGNWPGRTGGTAAAAAVGSVAGSLENERDKPVRREEDEPGVKGERKVVLG